MLSFIITFIGIFGFAVSIISTLLLAYILLLACKYDAINIKLKDLISAIKLTKNINK